MKTIESYKHLFSKILLGQWLEKDYTVEIEKPFYIDGKIAFIPDLACYSQGALIKTFEVVNKSPVDGRKLSCMQSWAYRNFTGFSCFEISAEYILSQLERPETLSYLNIYEIYPHETADNRNARKYTGK